MPLDLIARGLAAGYGSDGRGPERASDYEVHVPVIADASLDPSGDQCQGASIEVSSQRVVAPGAFERRAIKDPDQVTDLRSLLQLPRVIRKHALNPRVSPETHPRIRSR